MSDGESGRAEDRQEAWNPDLYDAKHAFVWQRGAEVISLLAPRPGERILDVGCGTGHLTQQIAEAGARVVGVDRSVQMVNAARKAYPNLQFEVVDARNLQFREEFDAVFSNAVLHWIPEQGKAVAGIWRALRKGGRFVGELGGQGNIRRIQAALTRALGELGTGGRTEVETQYYPSVSRYASLLEKEGFEVRYMTLFDRPTPLDDGEAGIRNWIMVFRPDLVARVPAEKQGAFLGRVEELLRPELFRDGTWVADYRRLRFAAWK